MHTATDRSQAEARFRDVFAHLGGVTAYARRRGSTDPEGIAAEAMAIAWRRLADVPADDARPWLYSTARNLLHTEWRRRQRLSSVTARETDVWTAPVELDELEPNLARALQALPAIDREALLLVAWEDLTPALAARSLGIREATFRVRLHRARRRFEAALAAPAGSHRTLAHATETEDR